MPDWECPECNGGFPSPVDTGYASHCPWCGEQLHSNAREHGDYNE